MLLHGLVDRLTGKSVMSQVRTSSGTFLPKKQVRVAFPPQIRVLFPTGLPHHLPDLSACLI